MSFHQTDHSRMSILAHAFTHYVYDSTGGDRVIADLQGM